MYNLTNLENSDTIFDLFTYANSASGSILFGFFTIALFFILVIVMFRNSNDIAEALLGSSAVCLIISSFLVYMKFIIFIYPLAFIIILAGTAFMDILYKHSR